MTKEKLTLAGSLAFYFVLLMLLIHGVGLLGDAKYILPEPWRVKEHHQVSKAELEQFHETISFARDMMRFAFMTMFVFAIGQALQRFQADTEQPEKDSADANTRPS